MGFRELNFTHFAKFNSAASSDLLTYYEDNVIKRLREESAKPKSRTFAPSSFRCDRKCWFRLRGTTPDTLMSPDVVLNFKAEVGTARHVVIQTNLRDLLGVDWVDIEQFLTEHPIPYQYTLTKNGLETLISISDPPIRFACDGIIRWNRKLYLLEIKTADYSSWESLTEPKSVHMDQIRCYSTLLGLPDVLVIYEDRQYGGMKCYEIHISDAESKAITDKFAYIQQMVEYNLAPSRLDYSDYACHNCEYQKKCKEWG